MRFMLLPLLLLAGLTGCSDPKSAAIPADLTQMETIRPQLEKLKPEEKELFASYLMRRAMQGTMLQGMAGTTNAKTIGDAIENQRAFASSAAKQEAESNALKAQAKAERDAALKAMRDVVTVAVVSKGIHEDRGASGIVMDRQLRLSVAYKNNAAKEIAGVKGLLVIKDLFGDTISEFLISNDETIKVGGGVVWTGGRSVQYALGSNKDEKFAELPDDKYKVVWEPEMIVFGDGTKLSATTK